MASNTRAPVPPDPGGHPWQIPHGLLTLLRGALGRAKANNLQVMAAGVAFRVFLSLFPSALAAVAIFARFGDPEALVAQAAPVLPDEVRQLVEGRIIALAETQGTGLVAVGGILVGLWAAMSAAAMLIKALNQTNRVSEGRGAVAQRGTALLIVLALFSAFAALLALVVLGPQIRRWLLPDALDGPLAAVLIQLGQLVVALVILVVLFAFVYWIGPAHARREWAWWSPGAVVGVVGWVLASAAFAIYTQTAADYEATYAGLAGVIVTMLWLQLSMAMLLFGAEVNAERRRLQEVEEVVQAGSGMALAEPMTEPFAPTPARTELPGLAVRMNGAPRRAAAAAILGTAAAVAAVTGYLRGRR